ncbi:hypothetical protein IWW45_009351, partial [Coemansia sp. RSA 485]
LGAFVSQNPTTPSHLEPSPTVRIIAATAAHTGPEPAENTHPRRPGALLLVSYGRRRCRCPSRWL